LFRPYQAVSSNLTLLAQPDPSSPSAPPPCTNKLSNPFHSIFKAPFRYKPRLHRRNYSTPWRPLYTIDFQIELCQLSLTSNPRAVEGLGWFGIRLTTRYLPQSSEWSIQKWVSHTPAKGLDSLLTPTAAKSHLTEQPPDYLRMTSPQSNPRRRHLNGIPTATLCQSLHTRFSSESNPSLDSTRPLRKSSTFHSPTTPPAQDDDPILNIPLLPRRSPTCPKALENAVAAGERRIANLLGAVDRSLSGLDGFSADSQETLTPAEDLPVPRFLLDAHLVDADSMDVDIKQDDVLTPERKHRPTRKHHRSDSGIGSSITDPAEFMIKDETGRRLSLVITPRPAKADFKEALNGNSYAATAGEVRSGINGSTFANRDPITGAQHALSEYACRQIQRYIISPIVRESSLKDFHPLVQGIPYRVARKEITCLRDLEKVLLWLAPVSHSSHVWGRRLAHCSVFGVKKWSISKASFLNFCETSIQCIHTTVDYLNESDQRRPTDRPYTNGYFLDLTEQVRQYAAMITASRERIAAGRGSAEDEAIAYVLR